MRKFKIIYCLFALLFLISGCRNKMLYEGMHEFGSEGWHLSDTAYFDVNLADTSQVLDMGFTFRHSDRYPYSNLWLFLSIESPEGIHIKDTLDLFLAQPNGKWLGHRKHKAYEISSLYRYQTKMAQAGNYKFSVVHGMRREILPAIERIEFWIQTSH